MQDESNTMQEQIIESAQAVCEHVNVDQNPTNAVVCMIISKDCGLIAKDGKHETELTAKVTDATLTQTRTRHFC